MRTLSLDTARALLAGDDDDRRRLEAAAARAMGWKPPATREDDDYDEWTRDGFVSIGLPPYLSDRADLNDEMERALRELAQCLTIQWNRGFPREWLWGIVLSPGAPGDGFEVQGPTKAEALVLALAALGMLKEDDQ